MDAFSSSSIIQPSVEHIVLQLEKNGIEPTEAVREEVRAQLKNELYRAGHTTFRHVLKKFKPAQDPVCPGAYSAKDIVVFEGGVFNILAVAPGGLVEMDDSGKPVKEERKHLQDVRDYLDAATLTHEFEKIIRKNKA